MVVKGVMVAKAGTKVVAMGTMAMEVKESVS